MTNYEKFEEVQIMEDLMKADKKEFARCVLLTALCCAGVMIFHYFVGKAYYESFWTM